MNLVEKIENEIFQQSRNGRDNMYIEVEDLKELGIYIDENKQGRAFVDKSTLQTALKRYKFKDTLKVDITPTKQETFKDVEKDVKNIENKQPDESWDSVTK